MQFYDFGYTILKNCENMHLNYISYLYDTKLITLKCYTRYKTLLINFIHSSLLAEIPLIINKNIDSVRKFKKLFNMSNPILCFKNVDASRRLLNTK